MTTKDPYTGLHAESIYAMWHDPLTYDYLKHGPPYLPDLDVQQNPDIPEAEFPTKVSSDQRSVVRTFVANKLAEFKVDLEAVALDMVRNYGDGHQPMAWLGVALAALRAEVWLFQSYHWQTRGGSFYGDHLLFERLYNDANGLVDGLAEKAVGTGEANLVDPSVQLDQVLGFMGIFRGSPMVRSSGDYPVSALAATLRVLTVLRMAYALIERDGDLSPGVDNMLQGIADKHEEFVYLLKQRTSVKTDSELPLPSIDVRSARWKV